MRKRLNVVGFLPTILFSYNTLKDRIGFKPDIKSYCLLSSKVTTNNYLVSNLKLNNESLPTVQLLNLASFMADFFNNNQIVFSSNNSSSRLISLKELYNSYLKFLADLGDTNPLDYKRGFTKSIDKVLISHFSVRFSRVRKSDGTYLQFYEK